MSEDIDKRIERAIDSVASKKADMARWETQRVEAENHRKNILKRWRTYGISAAASIAVVCFVGIRLFTDRQSHSADEAIPTASFERSAMDYDDSSESTVFRGGAADINEISAMIDSGKYQEALHTINVAKGDTAIDPSLSADRREYLRSVNAERLYELKWMEINVYLEMGKKDYAIRLLQSYVNEDGDHQQEAKQILEVLRK